MTDTAEPKTAPLTARSRTASREVRRKQLIEATIEAIARHGLSGATMATVTRLANVSMGLVSFHFESKENLLLETLIYMADEHRAVWREKLSDPNLSPAERLAAVIDAHFHEDVCNESRIAVWFAFFGEARYREAYRNHISQYDQERTDAVAAQCRALMVDPATAEEAALNIESLADGLWLSLLLYPDWLSLEGARRQMQSHLAQTFPQHFSNSPSRPQECEA
ncbi:MAG: transcriptional regulator BetI [Pseudomonadota bacterium]